MSNSNDAINLERLETIGDSFLKEKLYHKFIRSILMF